MNTLLVSSLLLILPAVVIASGKVPEKAVAAKLAPDALFRLTPESFAKQPSARRILDRNKFDSGLFSAALFHATNRERARHKLPPLFHSEALRRAAEGHSRDMAQGGFFSHKNPKDPARRTMKERLELEGVGEGFRSENIAKSPGQGLTYLTAAETIVAHWMKSRGHRGAILDRNMRHLGCGAEVDPASPHLYLLATQNFSSAVPN
jgi:uncharacterized protein YkwD